MTERMASGASFEAGSIARVVRRPLGLSAARVARSLVLLGSAVLCLSSAATVEVAYTLRASYALVGLAVVVGAASALRGCRRLPFGLLCFAASLLIVYCIAAVVDDGDTVPGLARAAGYRAAVYVADLGLGFAAVALVVGLWRRLEEARALVVALVVGGALGALYGLYQWPAQHYGWPFSDINNTLDSNGVTRGSFQGVGVFGLERIRGTFLEPQFLAAFLATMLPLAIALAFTGRQRTRLFGSVSAFLMLLALALTGSAPTIALLVAAALASLALFAAARGRALATLLTVAALVVTVVLGPAAVSSSRLAGALTGRSATELAVTSNYRTQQWRRSIDIWSMRPVLGFGPGQSSIQHTIGSDLLPEQRPLRPNALASAQGLWAAALIDTGVIGFSLWFLFLGTALLTGARAVLRSPTALRIGLFAAATSAVANSQIGGDRLDLRVWLLVGLLLIAARERDDSEGKQAENEKAAQQTD